MKTNLVKLSEKEAESLINDPEICPEDPLHILLPKILKKAGKPLHLRDLEFVVVNKGHYQLHSGKIPKDTVRPLFAVLRESNGIHKISKGIYGLTEWQNAASDVSSNEEIEVVSQAIQENPNTIGDSVEDFDNEEKNCPKCGEKIEIQRHFCTSCGTDLSVFCKNCLYEIKDHWIFCGDCGTRLKTDDITQ